MPYEPVRRGVHVRQQAFEVGAIVLDVVDHPGRSAGIADQCVDRTEQRDVHRPNGAHWRDAVCHAGVKDRNQPSPAVARRVPVALEFNEDNVGLVDAALRMLSAIVGHLDRNRGVTRLALVLQQLPGERPARPRVDRGGRAGGRTGARAEGGRWCRGGAQPSGGFEQAASPTPTTPTRTARRLICAMGSPPSAAAACQCGKAASS